MRRNLMNAMGLAVLTAIALPAVGDAQTPRGERGHRGGGPIERVLEQREALELTDAQVTRIEQIRSDLEQKNAPLLAQLEQARAERPQQRSGMRERMRQRRDRMTPEQRAQMRERMEQMTPEQREAMRERMHSQMATRLEDMPPEQREAFEQLHTNTQAAMEQVQTVLTDEQKQKLREMRPAGREGARRGPAPRGAR